MLRFCRLHLASRVGASGRRDSGEFGVCTRPAPTREATMDQMDQESFRLSIQRKIRDGRLPYEGITKIWSSPSAGETCDACDASVSLDQLVMEGTTRAPSRRPFTFHVRCFQIWDRERRAA